MKRRDPCFVDRRVLVRGLAPVALLWVVSGCGAELDEAASAGVDCQSVGCPGGLVCGPDGICTPQARQQLRLALRVVPPAESELFEEHLTDLVVDGPTDLGDVLLSPATTVEGTATIAGTEMAAVGRIVFTRNEGIEATPIRREVTTDSEDGSYAIDLVPGSYRVTFRPEQLSVPPLRRELMVSGNRLRYDLELPDTESYYRVQGRAVRRRVDSDEDIPVAGARVVLLSSSSGATISTASETDVDGLFTVTALPAEPDYVLLVGPGEMNALIPELSVPPVVITESTDLGVLMLGTWNDPVPVTGNVIGQNAEQRPVANATVFFQRELELGSFSQLVRSEEEGVFALSLIPGTYDMTVVPPVDAIYGASSFDEVAADGTIETPPLQHKPVIVGSVLSPTRQALSGVRITAEPTGYSVSLLDLGPISTESISDGSFELAVHPGTQRILLQPPGGTPLAPRLASLAAVDHDLRLDVVLDVASTLAGTVRASNGAVLVGATVEGFVEFDGTLIAFGTVDTDEDGRFVLALPTLGL